MFNHLLFLPLCFMKHHLHPHKVFNRLKKELMMVWTADLSSFHLSFSLQVENRVDDVNSSCFSCIYPLFHLLVHHLILH